MYISKVLLNKRKHETIKAMYNLNIMHSALENCFIGERQHPIQRIDQTNDEYYLMIISKDIPDFTSFNVRFGFDNCKAGIKNYDTFIKKLHINDVLKFHITVNPTITKKRKRIPLNMNRTEKQPYCSDDWLKDRIQTNGAEIISAQISSYEHHQIIKNDRKITLVTATFDGNLKVTDIDKFSKALIAGIGHEKAYGCGMLSVMR